jgi:O-antigen/teichoic acid export membrane protein
VSTPLDLAPPSNAASGPPADGDDAASIQHRVRSGLVWKASSTGFLQITRVTSGLVLARLLTPHQYGIAGMVTVFASLVLVFSDLSLGAALVQRKTLSERDRSTVFWTSAGVGLLLTLVGIALSGPLASFYGQPQVQPLFVAMSLSFVVAAIVSTQSALLTRDMNFRTLELRQMVSALASSAVAIAVAASGFGPWALIAQQLVLVCVSTTLLWFGTSWRPSFTYSLRSLRDLGGYSGNVFGARLLFYLSRNADNILIGRVVGAAALGAYSVAYNLMLLPFSQISVPAQDVLFPALARMQHDVRRVADAWLRTNRMVASLTVPMLVGLALVAPDFVDAVLGTRWHAATIPLQILCWVGLLQSLQGLNGSVLRACDRTDLLFRYAVVVAVASLAAFIFGLRWGIVGVSAAYAVSSTIVEPYYTWLTCRVVGTTLWEFCRSLAGIAQAAAVMAVAVLGSRIVLLHVGTTAWERLLTLIAIGAAVYIPVCMLRAPEAWAEVRVLLRRRLAPAL